VKRAGLLVSILVGAPVAYFTLPAVGTPSGAALNHSLTHRAEGMILLDDSYPCVPRDRRTFTCEIYDSRGSGLVLYSVTLAGRCWRARKLGTGSHEEGPPLPRRSQGCVSLRDQMRPLERFL